MRQPARNKLVCNRNGTGFYSAELEPPATVDERRLEVHCCCPSVRLRGQRFTRYISPLFVVPTRQVACEPAGTFPLGQLTVVPSSVPTLFEQTQLVGRHWLVRGLRPLRK